MCPRVHKRRSLLRDESGWALMDAVWSSVIVVMAFLASTAVFDNANKTAARESKNTQGLAVAQSQLNWMRSVGQASEANLLALNDTSKTVPYRGTNFTVSYKAVPTSGLGEGQVEACSVSLDAAGDSTALPDGDRYINMRVVVTYPGQIVGTTTSASGPSAAEPIALDSNFAAERGADVVITGMLRVYVLDREGAPATGVSGVTVKTGSTTINPTATNADKGCYLFTALNAGSYDIQVATAKQDVYLGNTSGTVIRSYQMPTGELRSTSVTVESPVSVTPIFKTYNNAARTSTAVVDPTASNGANNVNTFVKGADNLGNWVGNSSEILNNYNSSFFVNPGGALFPSSNSPVSDKSRIYPTDLGYGAYAGPCRVNDPTESNWVQIPSNPDAASWLPGATLDPRPELWLTQLKPSATLTPVATSRPSQGSVGWYNTVTFYWGQSLTSAQVQVALVGSSEGATSPSDCNAGYALGSDNASKWRRLPGQFTASGGSLDDLASSLPTGRYAVCVRAKFSYYQQSYYGGGLFGIGSGWQGSSGPYSDGVGYSAPVNQSLGYKAAPVTTSSVFSPPNTGTRQAANTSTSCGDPAKWS